jgi:hypothetical protein
LSYAIVVVVAVVVVVVVVVVVDRILKIRDRIQISPPICDISVRKQNAKREIEITFEKICDVGVSIQSLDKALR